MALDKRFRGYAQARRGPKANSSPHRVSRSPGAAPPGRGRLHAPRRVRGPQASDPGTGAPTPRRGGGRDRPVGVAGARQVARGRPLRFSGAAAPSPTVEFQLRLAPKAAAPSPAALFHANPPSSPRLAPLPLPFFDTRTRERAIYLAAWARKENEKTKMVQAPRRQAPWQAHCGCQASSGTSIKKITAFPNARRHEVESQVPLTSQGGPPLPPAAPIKAWPPQSSTPVHLSPLSRQVCGKEGECSRGR